MTEIDLSQFGAQFSEIRTLTKELEALGVRGLETQLPSVAMDTMEDALQVVINNLHIIKDFFIVDIKGNS